jgi:transposase
VADLEQTAETIRRLEAELALAKTERDTLISKALKAGASIRQVAAIAGVSKSRVDQIRRGTHR